MTSPDPLPYRTRLSLVEHIERREKMDAESWRRFDQRRREERTMQALQRAIWIVAAAAALVWALS